MRLFREHVGEKFRVRHHSPTELFTCQAIDGNWARFINTNGRTISTRTRNVTPFNWRIPNFRKQI